MARNGGPRAGLRVINAPADLIQRVPSGQRGPGVAAPFQRVPAGTAQSCMGTGVAPAEWIQRPSAGRRISLRRLVAAVLPLKGQQQRQQVGSSRAAAE